MEPFQRIVLDFQKRNGLKNFMNNKVCPLGKENISTRLVYPYYSDKFKLLFHVGQVTADMLKSRSQKELLDILNMVKTKEINMHEAELLFSSWQQQYNGGMTQSFRDRRVRRGPH